MDLGSELMAARGGGVGEVKRGGMDWEFGIDTCMLLYIKWISNRDLL